MKSKQAGNCGPCCSSVEALDQPTNVHDQARIEIGPHTLERGRSAKIFNFPMPSLHLAGKKLNTCKAMEEQGGNLTNWISRQRESSSDKELWDKFFHESTTRLCNLLIKWVLSRVHLDLGQWWSLKQWFWTLSWQFRKIVLFYFHSSSILLRKLPNSEFWSFKWKRVTRRQTNII